MDALSYIRKGSQAPPPNDGLDAMSFIRRGSSNPQSSPPTNEGVDALGFIRKGSTNQSQPPQSDGVDALSFIRKGGAPPPSDGMDALSFIRKSSVQPSAPPGLSSGRPGGGAAGFMAFCEEPEMPLTKKPETSTSRGGATGFMAYCDDQDLCHFIRNFFAKLSLTIVFIPLSAVNKRDPPSFASRPTGATGFMCYADDPTDSPSSQAVRSGAAGFLQYADETPDFLGGGDGNPVSATVNPEKADDKRSSRFVFGRQTKKPAATGSVIKDNRASRQVSVVDFDEEDDEDIRFSDETVNGRKLIKAATLSRLVEALTQETLPDPKFRDSFLITYRAFTTPDGLFEQLVTRYDPTQVLSNPSLTKRRVRVVGVIKAWIEQFFFDFKEESMRSTMEEFLVNMELTMGTAAKQLRATFEKAQARLEEESLPVYVHAAAPAPMPAGGWTSLNERVLAEQMTLLDSKMYLAVQPKECLAWNKKDKETNAPNLCLMIKHFNAVSGWVTSSIVSQIRRAQRVDMLKKFIRLMELLRELNNFNGMMEILSGINNASVRRMKDTFADLDDYTARLTSIETLLSHQFSYRGYRDTLHSTVPPCVPYMGVYLTDLTFVLDGNQDKVEGDLINFFKFRKVAEIVVEIKSYQFKYSLDIAPDIVQFLTTLTSMTEEEWYAWSTKVEPKVPEKAIGDLIQKEADLDCRVSELKKREEELLTRYLTLTGSAATRENVVREMCSALSLPYTPPPAPASSSVSLAAKKSSVGTSIPIVVTDPVVEAACEYISLWRFETDDEEEVALSAGEVVELVSGDDDDWCLVKNVIGKQGYVPRAYIRPLEREPPPPKLSQSLTSLSSSSSASSVTPLSGSSSASLQPGSSSASASPSPKPSPKMPNLLHRTASSLVKQVEGDKGRTDSPGGRGGGDSVTSTPRTSSKSGNVPWTSASSGGVSLKRDPSPTVSRPSGGSTTNLNVGGSGGGGESGSKINKFFGEDAGGGKEKEKKEKKKKGLFGLKKG